MAIDKDLYRRLAGSFASGVTVITTGHNGIYHGMTASAFASLSLEPLLVLICVEKTAHTYPVLDQSGVFNVNILSASQEGMSRVFASKDSPEAHGLVGVNYRLGETGAPLLAGTLAFMECRVVGRYDGGDHTIFTGEVLNGGLGDGDEPLIYYRGRYRRLAPLDD
jgi:flavin reductase (DIM6/NTAB) family NADH-FMN oxidoreductase RutF